MLGVLLVLTSSTNSINSTKSIAVEMTLNETEVSMEMISRLDRDLSDVWRIILYVALFLMSK